MTFAKKLSTIFFIYGGGFTEGTGDNTLHGPDFFMEKDVILVTFNYRLGALGFMSLGDDVYSGNMGLKDQHLALQWTSDNIERFGGDKNQITIAGHSAGGDIIYVMILYFMFDNIK